MQCIKEAKGVSAVRQGFSGHAASTNSQTDFSLCFKCGRVDVG